MTSGTGAAHAKAYGAECERLIGYGVKVDKAVIDNEFPEDLQAETKRLHHHHHFASPNMHHRLITERANTNCET